MWRYQSRQIIQFRRNRKNQKEQKMVAEYETNSQPLKRVAEIYKWLDSQIRKSVHLAGICDACGKCCNFAQFDHRLFVTTPELMYLAAYLGVALTAKTAESAEKKEKNKNKIKRSDNTKNFSVLCELGGKREMSRCPYNIDGKCSVYEHRFSGCRIFSCKGDTDFQSRLSESAVKKFKAICEQFQIPYRYTDLATALNGFSVA
jgi:Fe-S-cluster containining protein